MATVQLDLPDELLAAFSVEDVRTIATEQLVLILYERGAISSGKVAELLGMSRRDALTFLSEHQLSVFDETMDLAAELRTIERHTRPSGSNV